MADEPNEIKNHIDYTRRELNGNLHELEDRVKQATDWRTYVNRYPFTVVGLAFTGGVALSMLTKGSSGTHVVNRSGSSTTPSFATHKLGQKATEMWEGIRDAMLGLASHQITTLLGEAIPGFRQQYEKTERQRQASWSEQVH